MPDVIVIGAGPAGSAASLLLARGGIAVTLVEQHRFPRQKVCGECVSALGLDVLGRLGALDSFRPLPPAVLTHAAVHTVCGKSVRVKLPRPMWGISRAVFDTRLLELARAAGAVIRQPARCEGLEAGPAVRLRDPRTNRVEVIRAERVLLADGKGALMPQGVRSTGDFGIKAHFESVDGPRDTIELFGCRGLYGGLAAVEGGRWNAGFSVPAERLLRCRGDLAALFDEIARENPVLWRRVRGAKLAGEWIAAPLPRFGVKDAWPAGVTPIGNAAAAIEPIGGEGMGLALRSAELAVESLIGGLDREPVLLERESSVGGPTVWQLNGKDLRRVFRSLWRRRRSACRAGAIVTSRPHLARMLVPMLTNPIISDSTLRLIGKV